MKKNFLRGLTLEARAGIVLGLGGSRKRADRKHGG